MCWAVGCLLFGVWVKSSDLKFAAEAYDRVKAPLKALELIKQRQRTGVLLCKDQETRKTVRDFSREIWSRIGQHLIDGEIEAAEQEAIRGYRCPGCAIVMNVDEGRRWAGWADKNAERKGEVWRSGWEPSCEYCMEGVYEGDPFEKPDFKLVQALLGVYGLCTPYDEVWKSDPESYHDFDALSAIALPLASKLPLPASTNPNARRNNSYPALTAEAIHDYGSGSHVINIDPRIFTRVPADSEQRFDALVKRWRLEKASRTDTTILPDTPATRDDAAQEDVKGNGKKKVKKLKGMSERDKLRPHWMVWSLCEPCD